MSNTSNNQKLAVFKVWLAELKIKDKTKSNPNWKKRIVHEN